MAARSWVKSWRNTTRLTPLRFPGSCCVPNRRRGAEYSAPLHRSSDCKPAAAARPQTGATARNRERNRGYRIRPSTAFTKRPEARSAPSLGVGLCRDVGLWRGVGQAEPHLEHMLREALFLIGADCRAIAAVHLQAQLGDLSRAAPRLEGVDDLSVDGLPAIRRMHVHESQVRMHRMLQAVFCSFDPRQPAADQIRTSFD